MRCRGAGLGSSSWNQAGKPAGAEKGLFDPAPGLRNVTGGRSRREAKRTLLASLILASSLYAMAMKHVGQFDGRSMTIAV